VPGVDLPIAGGDEVCSSAGSIQGSPLCFYSGSGAALLDIIDDDFHSSVLSSPTQYIDSFDTDDDIIELLSIASDPVQSPAHVLPDVPPPAVYSHAPPSDLPPPCSCHSLPLGSCPSFIKHELQICFQVFSSGIPNQDGLCLPLRSNSINPVALA
jgi:hypothetical protein